VITACLASGAASTVPTNCCSGALNAGNTQCA
jgi:hypothetical protein